MHHQILKLNLCNYQLRKIGYYKVRNWYANLTKPKQEKPPYKHVVQIGDPILRNPANPVLKDQILSDNIQNILQRMKFVYNKYSCVGLSAPQIGIPLRIIVVGLNKKQIKEYTKEETITRQIEVMPFTILINPEMIILDYKKITFPESCESIRGFWADVPRYHSLTVKALNEDANEINLSVEGWTARIIQHEMDHIDGKLYTDVMDRKSLTCSCWEVVNERNGRVSLPFFPS